jgi:hypothetical protein
MESTPSSTEGSKGSDSGEGEEKRRGSREEMKSLKYASRGN